VYIGITDISESEARRHLYDAGFSDCGVEFSIFETQLVGAAFTRCCPVRVWPGTVIRARGNLGNYSRALLGGAINHSDVGPSGHRYMLSVAHLFNQVGSVDDALLLFNNSRGREKIKLNKM